MANNRTLCESVARAFRTYLETGSRSDKKLHDIHGQIAKDIDALLNKSIKDVCVDVMSASSG